MKTPNVDIIWDALLSLFFRALCTAALFAGVNFLNWTWTAWQTDHFVDQEESVRLAFGLAIILTIAACIGTFRRGRAENNFSIFQIASAVSAGTTGVYWTRAPGAPPDGRVLRRFPTFESVLIGGSLILLWVVNFAIQPQYENIWLFQNGAIIGAIQILWGLTVGRMTIRKSAKIFSVKANARVDS